MIQSTGKWMVFFFGDTGVVLMGSFNILRVLS